MADGNLSSFTALTGANADAAADLFYIWDDSETGISRSKKMTGAELRDFVNRGTIYEEIYIDAAAMVPRTTNGAEAATEEYATNDVMSDHLLFDSVTEEGAQFKIAMPDSWDRLTIKAKFFWDAATGASAADGVTWGIAAEAMSNDDALDNAFAASVDTDDTVIAVGDLHVSAASAAVTVGNTPAVGDLLLFEITRVVGDANDTMSEDAKLLGVQIQFGRIISNSTAW